MHSAHLKLREWGVGELSVSYVIERIIPQGVPKHTSSFYLDKYRFAAGDHDLELRERERVRMLCFISKSVTNAL